MLLALRAVNALASPMPQEDDDEPVLPKTFPKISGSGESGCSVKEVLIGEIYYLSL